MKIVIFGATGMVGSGALLEALDDPDVTEVRVIVRRPSGRSHPKLVEVIHSDFLDFGPVEDQLKDLDACLWCLGVSSAGMSEDDYRRVTVGFTRAAAETLKSLNPDLAMSFVSGSGTDPQGRQMWARVKGEAETLLLGMGFRRATMFRPAGIEPKRGVVSRTRSYRITYLLLGWAMPMLRALMPKMMTDSVTLGRALLRATKESARKPILENHEINEWMAGA